MPATQRLFAVIPAAGESRRMGRPKLLLPLAGKTVIARLLEALAQPAISARVVVVRSDDEPLRAAAATAGATVVQPASPPPDMRASVACALDEILRRYAPADSDGWMLVPADHPVLDRATIAGLLARWQTGLMKILVPTFGGRRGHPVLFRWELAREVADIPPDRGLDWLLERHAADVIELEVPDRSVLDDLDTPQDYDALRRLYDKSDGGE